MTVNGTTAVQSFVMIVELRKLTGRSLERKRERKN